MKALLMCFALLMGCSEEEYCEGRYVDYYIHIDGGYTEPVYTCP